MRLIAAFCVLALAAAPAFAGERPRLVGGGTDLLRADFSRGAGAGSSQVELYGTDNFSAGAVTGPERMSLGGYASYLFNDMRLTTSLKGDEAGRSAHFDASYSSVFFGIDGTAAFRIGYEWGGESGFSPNPAQMGVNVFDGLRPGSDLSLSLSLTHDVTPAFSLGGFAAASQGDSDAFRTPSEFTLGAGLGLKF
jgi:hypothetical protein